MGAPLEIAKTTGKGIALPFIYGGKKVGELLGIGGGSQGPAPLPAVPTAADLPKAPAAPPPPPDATDAAVRAAREGDLRRGRKLGYRTTILTGAGGAPGTPTIRGTRLLGF